MDKKEKQGQKEAVVVTFLFHLCYQKSHLKKCFPMPQAFCSAACRWFGVVACKIHAVRTSFVLPVYCTEPAVLLLVLILFQIQAQKLEGAKHGDMTGKSFLLFLLKLN